MPDQSFGVMINVGSSRIRTTPGQKEPKADTSERSGGEFFLLSDSLSSLKDHLVPFRLTCTWRQSIMVNNPAALDPGQRGDVLLLCWFAGGRTQTETCNFKKTNYVILVATRLRHGISQKPAPLQRTVGKKNT